MLTRSALPVLVPQAAHMGELAHVVRHQHQVARPRLPGNQHVI